MVLGRDNNHYCVALRDKTSTVLSYYEKPDLSQVLFEYKALFPFTKKDFSSRTKSKGKSDNQDKDDSAGSSGGGDGWNPPKNTVSPDNYGGYYFFDDNGAYCPCDVSGKPTGEPVQEKLIEERVQKTMPLNSENSGHLDNSMKSGRRSTYKNTPGHIHRETPMEVVGAGTEFNNMSRVLLQGNLIMTAQCAFMSPAPKQNRSPMTTSPIVSRQRNVTSLPIHNRPAAATTTLSIASAVTAAAAK